MKRLFLFAAVSAIALTACNKEITPEVQTGNGVLSFVGKISVNTKTSMEVDAANNVSNVVWTEGDQIGVFGFAPGGSESIGDNVAYTAEYGDVSTRFVNNEAGLDFGDGSGTRAFYAYYPYNSANTDVTAVSAVVPSVQTYANGDNASKLFMYASGSATSPTEVTLGFKNIFALLEIGVKFPGITLSELSIEPNVRRQSTPLAGAATINLKTGATTEFNYTSKKITVVFEGGLTLGSDAVWVPISVLPFECIGGLKVTFKDNAGNTYTKQIWKTTRINSDQDGKAVVVANAHLRQPLAATLSDCAVLSMTLTQNPLTSFGSKKTYQGIIDLDKKIVKFATKDNLNRATVVATYSEGATCADNLSTQFDLSGSKIKTITVTASDGKTSAQWTLKRTDPMVASGFKASTATLLWTKKLTDIGYSIIDGSTTSIATNENYVVVNQKGNSRPVYLNITNGNTAGNLNLSSLPASMIANYGLTSDQAGNVLIYNKVDAGQTFELYYIKDFAAAPSLLGSFVAGAPTGNRISVVGNIDKNAIITSHYHYIYDGQFPRWQMEEGDFVTPWPVGVNPTSFNFSARDLYSNENFDVIYTDPSDVTSDYYVSAYFPNYTIFKVDGVTNLIEAEGDTGSSNFTENSVDFIKFNNASYVASITSDGFGWSGTKLSLYDVTNVSGNRLNNTPLNFATGATAVNALYGPQQAGGTLSTVADVKLQVSEDDYYLYVVFMWSNGYVGCIRVDGRQ